MAFRTRFSSASPALTSGLRIGMSQAQRRDGSAGSYRLAAIIGPGGHEAATLLKGIAAAIGSLDRVRDRMRKCSLADLAREVSVLPAPVAESATHAVHGRLVAKTLQELTHRALAQVPPSLAWKHERVPFTEHHFIQNGE